MSLIKIANVIEDGRVAGPQLRILATAHALMTDGIMTTVILPKVNSELFAKKLSDSGILMKILPLRRLTRNKRQILSYIVWFPYEIYLLTRIFRKEHFDFVHCSGGFWQIKGLIAARLAGVKAIWHMNDTILPTRLRWLFRIAARCFAYKLIFAGSRVRSHYLGDATSPVPSHVIQAPVDCKRFDPTVVEPEPRLAMLQGLKVVTVSALNPLKGIEHFIAMAAKVKDQGEVISFHIIGPAFDSQNDYLKKLNRQIIELGLKNVHFYGRANDVPSVLAAADIYVCSSISEASPTAVWEAMAMAKAVVSTDVGEVSRFVRNGVSGYVVPIADSGLMADVVERLATNPLERAALGAAARQVALAELDLPVVAAAHRSAYC